MSYILIIFVLVLFSEQIYGNSNPDTLLALKINEYIEVDGDLDENAWEKAEKISDFTQRELSEGQPATEQTEVAIIYNETHLYVGVWAYDSEPDKLIAKESKRDFNWRSDDNFEIILGPFNDKRTAYLFVINPNGAMADVLVSDEGLGMNIDWNGVWNVEVEVDEEGWFAEIEIPFSTFKFPDTDDQLWAINLERNIRRKNEQVLWQAWSRNYNLETISRAGILEGIKGIHGESPMEFKPFINMGFEKERGESNLRKIKVGGDINYQFSPRMKLNLTVNTDFAQVEDDREEINLTRFSLSYPEKREFFLEGKRLFEFSLGKDAQIFYSRRIGLHERKAIPLLGGIRFVGKTGGTNIGMMSIQSAKKDSLSSANYTVVRLKQDVLEQSSLGIILTSKNDANHYNYVYGFDATYATSEFLGDKNLEMGIAFSQSQTENQENDKNLGYKAYITYPNDLIEFYLHTFTIEKDFNPEIGFLRRKDYQLYLSELEFKPRPSFLPYIRNLEIVPFELEYYLTNHNHKLESLQLEMRPLGFELKNGDKFEYNLQRFYDKPNEAFEIYDDIEIEPDEYWFSRQELAFESFRGRKLFSDAQYSWGNFYSGKRKELEFKLGWNINNRINLSADWEHNSIKLLNDNFTTDEVGGRVEYAFSTAMYASMFGQWNNEDDEVILNYRLNWIPIPGSYFYFVVNQELATSESTWALVNTTAIIKLIWRFSK